MQTLQEYITKHYGTQVAFAEAMSTTAQHVTKWKRLEYVVIKNALYKKMRDLPKK